MVLPGKQLTLRPAIYLTVLVYTPYLTFEEKTVSYLLVTVGSKLIDIRRFSYKEH